MTNTVTINRGSDLSFYMIWPDGNGGAMDLTGWSVDVYEPSDDIAAFLTVDITDKTAGRIDGVMQWDEGMPKPKLMPMSFRLRIRKGEQDKTSPIIKIGVQ